MPQEIELKLRVSPEHVAKLQRHRLLRAKGRSAKLLSVYFDTPDFLLKSKNIALRLRRDGRQWMQTVKGGGKVSAGLHCRDEIEAPVAKNALDYTKLDGIFDSRPLRRKLSPVFSTEFVRTSRLVDFDGSLIEYCLDRGEIKAKDKTLSLCEVELELKEGSPDSLYKLALELQKEVPLRIENRSKAERGYGLYSQPSPNSVAKARILPIRKKMPASEVFCDIAGSCIDQLETNASGFLAHEPDSEYLHQMRVAIRRLRSAIGIFSRIFGKERFSSLLAELKWLGAELGEARDWDVFCLETLPPIRHSLSEGTLAQLYHQSEKTRQIKLSQARAAVLSQQYQALLLEAGAALSGSNWPGDEAILEFCQDILDVYYCRVKSYGKNISELDQEGLHELRISGKKLRYAAEFFSPMFRKSGSFLAAVSLMQDALGAICDADTTRRLLDTLDKENREAVAIIKSWLESRTEFRKAGLEKLWIDFKTTKPFWR